MLRFDAANPDPGGPMTRHARFVPLLAALAAACAADKTMAPNLPEAYPTSDKLASLAVPPVSTALGQFPIHSSSELDQSVISQMYAEFNYGSVNAYHTGYDILPVSQSTHPQIFPVLNGTIVLVQQNGPEKCETKKGACNDHGFGNTIIVRHDAIVGAPSPINTTFYTQYSHLAQFDDAIVAACPTFKQNKKDWHKNRQEGGECRPDVPVTTATPLGIMGNSEYGRFGPNGVHLHFETKTFDDLNTSDPGQASGCSAVGFGYTCKHPSQAGYINPTLVFHGVTAISAPIDFELSQAAELIAGPGQLPPPVETLAYPRIGTLAERAMVTAVGSHPATAHCDAGWLLIHGRNNAPIPFEGHSGASVTEGWACLSTIQTLANLGLIAGDMTRSGTDLFVFAGSNTATGLDDNLIKVSLIDGTQTYLATHLPITSRLLSDGTYVFWMDGWAGGTSGAGNIKRVSVNGGPVEILASGLSLESSIFASFALDGTNVYFGSNTGSPSGTWSIKRVAKSGGLVTDVVSTNLFSAFTVDGGMLYYEDNAAGAIRRIPTSGGAPADIATGVTLGYSVGQIVVVGGTVYVSSGTDIWSVPTTGGTPTTIATGLGWPQTLTIDGSAIYFVNYKTSELLRYDLTDLSRNVIASDSQTSSTGVYAYAGMVVDATYVYWPNLHCCWALSILKRPK